MTRTQQLQTQFFNKIKDVIDPRMSLVDELADILKVSRDSVYRRIRNETSLSLEEIILLSEHFKIPFDFVASQSQGTVSFGYKSMSNQDDFKLYLMSMLQDLKKIGESEKKLVTYAANDVPVFHNFKFEDLTAFKIFYWMKGVVNDPSLQGKRFDKSLIDPEILELTKTLYQAYLHTPTREIWTQLTINSQIEQIRYFWDSGSFNSQEEALHIISQMSDLIKSIEEQVSAGAKSTGVALDFYYSEIEIGNNTVMVERGDSKMLFLGFNTFNKMLTTNKEYCEETEKWLENLVKKSVLISGVSEKQRYQFFKSLEKRIDNLKKYVLE